MAHYHFRKATQEDIAQIWTILYQAILRRKADGSEQWQDGYPNMDVIKNDINKGVGFVLLEGDTIIGYYAIIVNDEPVYEKIEGRWLTQDDFVVVHRLAVSEKYLGKGFATKICKWIEEYAISINIKSIKADTNFDNIAMLRIFEKLGYIYCGEVYFRGQQRKAFEKVLKPHPIKQNDL
jgi:GNAT superfamily N-acetyltransferase